MIHTIQGVGHQTWLCSFNTELSLQPLLHCIFISLTFSLYGLFFDFSYFVVCSGIIGLLDLIFPKMTTIISPIPCILIV